MKFLRLAFYVLIAQLVLSGCAGEGVEETSPLSSEINFDAYLGTNTPTRAVETNLASLKGTSGFSVFARHTHADGTISDMMDNEHVTWNGNSWGYTNTQYWPDNGSVDFYAYAPYIEGVKLVNAPGENKANPTNIEFNSFDNPVDLVLGLQESIKVPTTPSSASKVKFKFWHALARLTFDITANQQLEENGAVIKVKEVKLYGASEDEGALDVNGYLDLTKLNVTVFEGWSVVKDKSTRVIYTWTPPDTEDGGLKLTASQLDHTCTKIESDPNSYLCVIPQQKGKDSDNDGKWDDDPFYLQITYSVQQGTSQQTITVKKNLFDVSHPFRLERNRTYILHLKLPLNHTRTRSNASEDFSVTMSVSSIPE